MSSYLPKIRIWRLLSLVFESTNVLENKSQTPIRSKALQIEPESSKNQNPQKITRFGSFARGSHLYYFRGSSNIHPQTDSSRTFKGSSDQSCFGGGVDILGHEMQPRRLLASEMRSICPPPRIFFRRRRRHRWRLGRAIPRPREPAVNHEPNKSWPERPACRPVPHSCPSRGNASCDRPKDA